MRRHRVLRSSWLPGRATVGGANAATVPKTGQEARETTDGEPVNATHQETGR